MTEDLSCVRLPGGPTKVKGGVKSSVSLREPAPFLKEPKVKGSSYRPRDRALKKGSFSKGAVGEAD